MNKYIRIIIAVGFVCGVVGFLAGRSGMISRDDYDKYQQEVQRGIRDYKLHYFASREKMSDLFKYIDKREEWFYRDMPDSFKSGTAKPQCAIDLFGNLDRWRVNYTDRTKVWDSQVHAIEVYIASARPL